MDGGKVMYNFNDSWSVILDDRGKPLVGKIGFYEPDTTTLKNIFGTDEVIPLDNPIYCNVIPTNQVLLDEGDYTVRFWRYIGNGNMESDNNEDSWLLYKTELIKDGSVVSTDFSSGATVSTIDELKELDGMEDGDICLVQGYYTNDDCPSRYFVWNDNSITPDDGGVIIQSNGQNTGRWIMKIPGTYIDVRWYGDMPSNAWNGTSSNLGQRAKAAQAANKYKKDLYFPSYTKGTTNGFYVFNGSNTVSVNQNIICDSGVRFVVKYGTTGTSVSCSNLYKEGRYLFVSEQGKQIGGYELHCDWINTSWLNSNTVAPNDWANQGFVVDEMNSPLHLKNVKLKVENSPASGTTFENCEMNECNKKITNNITIIGMEIDTDWFADDYDYSKLTLSGCRILLENCKDANTYILLKNKQGEADYGDLGEQSINATVLGGALIENCYGTITVSTHGSMELHNASVTINGLSSNDTLNAVDSWITINQNITLGNIQLRRGSLAGTGSITLIGDSMIENAAIYNAINTTGILLTVRNSEIYGYITTRNIKLINNQIYNVIDQSDLAGIIHVFVSGNMFHDNGIHYVHASLAESEVNGVWVNNGSTYTDKHWIRLDRTNLKFQDIDHHYTYAGNSEPYLDQWSGRNRPMSFKMYSGHWTDSAKGTGIFATYNIPFMFLNDRDLSITCVPRQNYWKMFTVGRGNLCRSGCIKASCNAGEIGIMEGDYNDNKNGNVSPVFNWGCGTYNIQKKVMEDGTVVEFEDYPDSTRVGCAQCVCRDANGIAEYNCSFEGELVQHGEYSYGLQVGFFPSTNWNKAGGGGGGYGGSLNDKWVKYPATSYQIIVYIFIDKDFSTGSNPQNVFV